MAVRTIEMKLTDEFVDNIVKQALVEAIHELSTSIQILNAQEKRDGVLPAHRHEDRNNYTQDLEAMLTVACYFGADIEVPEPDDDYYEED
jgi:hypothetical protein